MRYIIYVLADDRLVTYLFWCLVAILVLHYGQIDRRTDAISNLYCRRILL